LFAAREKWNDNSVLYVPDDAQFLLIGAQAVASVLFLDKLNLKFDIKKVKNVCEMSPSGKSPVLKCGKYIIGEFETIVNFCELKNLSLHRNSSPEVKSQIKAYLSLVENTFHDLINYFLWQDDKCKQAVFQVYDSLYAWPLSKILYYYELYFVRNYLVQNKIWKLSKDEVINRLREFCEALEKRLSQSGEHIIDNRLTEVDIILYSYLRTIKNFDVFETLAVNIFSFANIQSYYNNLNNQFDEKLLAKLKGN